MTEPQPKPCSLVAFEPLPYRELLFLFQIEVWISSEHCGPFPKNIHILKQGSSQRQLQGLCFLGYQLVPAIRFSWGAPRLVQLQLLSNAVPFGSERAVGFADKHVCDSKFIILAGLIKQGPDLFFTWCLFYSLIIFISAALKLPRLLGSVKESCIDFSLNIIPSLFPSSGSSPAHWLTCGGGYRMSTQSRALSTGPGPPDLQSLWREGLDLERLDCILQKNLHSLAFQNQFQLSKIK